MKFIKSKKSLALLATLAVAVIAAVGAYAYFTNTGNGSNSAASVGSVANAFDVAVADPTGGTLYPTAADSANAVVDSYGVTVTNMDEAAEHVSQIEYTITTDQLGCSQADFSINGGATGATSDVPFDKDLAPNSDGAPTDQMTDTATVQMIDTGVGQDACQGATVTLHAAVS
jgi:hypothetical protein